MPSKHKIATTPEGKYDAYFSFWSWKMLKTCPNQYKLTLFDNLRPPTQDKGNSIQGGVPDTMSEIFFKMTPEERQRVGLQWFYDNFEQYWIQWSKEVDWDRKAKGKLKYDPVAKKKETLEHIQNLIAMLSERNFWKLNTLAQYSFKSKVFEDDSIVLTLGGRIDLVVEMMAGVWDIWDLKGVKNVSSNDVDQLLTYKMGLEAQGKSVRMIGFLNMKQKKFDPKVLPPDAPANLIREMVREYKFKVVTGNLPSIYNARTCSYCDVRLSCEAYKTQTANDRELDSLLAGSSGKVSF